MEVKELVPNLKIDDWINQYLSAYGINDPEEYLYPTFKYVESPNKYSNMEEGYQLLRETINNNQTIGFIMDCDVDGILSTAILYNYIINYIQLPFEKLEIKIYFHSDKKHGITENAISWVMNNDISLLIVPDAGTNDYTAHMDLNFLNVNILILDHHRIEPKPVFLQEYKSNYKTIIINNNQGLVKNKQLSGTGVVAKFIKYIDKKEKMSYSNKYTDLVALSLVSDMCDMTSYENRDFFLHGTHKINNEFLQYMVNNFIWEKDENENSIINQHTLGFDICPYLNAVCRGTNQELKKSIVEAFIGILDNTQYNALQESLKGEKAYQDKVVAQTVKEGCIDLVLSCTGIPVLAIMYLKTPESFPYTGLIANMIRKEYKCTAFVIHETNEIYSGSCRSEINILKKCQQSKLFEIASGHDKAYGIVFKKENLDNIKDFFKTIKQEIYKIPVVKTYNMSIDNIPKSLFGFADEWDFLWNNTFLKPVFNIENICINSKNIQVLGKGNTIKFKKDNIEFIKFRITEDEKEKLCLEESKDLCINTICNLTINEFRGRIILQAQIEIIEINYETKENKKITWEDVFGL